MKVDMKKDVALQNAIDALGEAERAMEGIGGRYTSVNVSDWAARRAEVWSSIGRGWAMVADQIPNETGYHNA